jgi:hypothetical protein
MGSGIAEVVASAGIAVTLVEKTPDLAERAAARIAASLEREVAKDRLTEAVRDRILARVAVESSLEAAAECNLIIEAVTEDFDVKRGGPEGSKRRASGTGSVWREGACRAIGRRSGGDRERRRRGEGQGGEDSPRRHRCAT